MDLNYNFQIFYLSKNYICVYKFFIICEIVRNLLDKYILFKHFNLHLFLHTFYHIFESRILELYQSVPLNITSSNRAGAELRKFSGCQLYQARLYQACKPSVIYKVASLKHAHESFVSKRVCVRICVYIPVRVLVVAIWQRTW